MKTGPLVAVFLMAAASASAQLFEPATPIQLINYIDWMGPLAPNAGLIVPARQLPDSLQIDTPARDWETWRPCLGLPSMGESRAADQVLHTEIVFLGETGNAWGRFGYQLGGVDFVLSKTANDRSFGNFATTDHQAPFALQFFIEALDGTRYSPTDSFLYVYTGKLAPLSSRYDRYAGETHDLRTAYTVIDLEFAPPEFGGTTARFVYAVNSIDLENPPIPEPAAFGIFAGTVLLTRIIARYRRASARYS